MRGRSGSRQQPWSSSPAPSGRTESALPRILDERCDPDFRTVFGRFVKRSTALDSAVARIRLAGFDLEPQELRNVERMRVLVGRINALTLRSEAEAMLVDPGKTENVQNLVKMMETQRVEVRAAPLAGWAPDFTVFRRREAPWALLVGLHWFVRPYPHRGPVLASVHGSTEAAAVAARFTALWNDGHDISPAVLQLLREARSRSGRGRFDTDGARDHPDP